MFGAERTRFMFINLTGRLSRAEFILFVFQILPLPLPNSVV